jgi:hypothetical protein
VYWWVAANYFISDILVTEQFVSSAAFQTNQQSRSTTAQSFAFLERAITKGQKGTPWEPSVL